MLVKFRNIKEIFDFFVGSWDIKRVCHNGLIAQGVANFKLIDVDNILYQEELAIKYNNVSCINKAYKEYLYCYHRHNNVLYKTFIDSRHFYDLDFDRNKSIATGFHLCNQDYYKATYQIFSLNHFMLNYEVVGPRKAYIINTNFMRFLSV
jgi:hypothetical protein